MLRIVSCLDADVEEEAEESKWQDRISSGFDRLVAFASTELFIKKAKYAK